MNDLEVLRDKVRRALPGTQSFLDRPAHPLGVWFLDFKLSRRRVVLQWKPRRGFGVTARKTEYGSGPDEVFPTVHTAARRVRELLVSGDRTREPREFGLGDIREFLKIPQSKLARSLGTSQVAVSGIERRSDILLSTLRKYVKGLGGTVDVIINRGGRELRLKGYGLQPQMGKSRRKSS